MIRRELLRWNGWGRLDEDAGVSSAREQAMLDELGRRFHRRLGRVKAPVEIGAIRLPPSKLGPEVVEALRAACGHDAVRNSAPERITHAAGKSLPDLLRLRRGEIDAAPEVVVYPADEGAVAAVLRVASEAQLAVVPFGGGTSVVGGVDPCTAAGQPGAICLDTTHLDRLVHLDAESRTATLQAGIDGPALEAALASQGYTLGHFPQSFEHSTLGGWIATRSVGQLSDGYGDIADLLVSARMVTPGGVVRTLEVPRTATGPDLNELVLGSEGVLGVIVEATLRVRPAPSQRDFRGMLFHSFADGVAAVRELIQARIPLAMLRLSDPTETELTLRMGRTPGRRADPAALLPRVAETLGYRDACMLLYGAEGVERARVREALRRARAVGRAHGGLPLGRSAGHAWQKERFRTPYLRDWLLDRGVGVDTVETALPWSRLAKGREAILRGLRGALEAHAGSGVAMAHLSHSYADGACLYFTMLWPLDAPYELEQWTAIKRAAGEAILGAGGTISHHHGVGRDHLAWMSREKGSLALDALRGLKHVVDPAGLMNPGKLL